jgi:hypothetical protein
MSHYVAFKSAAVGANLTVTERSFYALVTSLLTNEGVLGTGFIVEQTASPSGQVKVNDGFIAVNGNGFKYLAQQSDALTYELASINPNSNPSFSRRDLIIYHIDTTALVSTTGGGKIIVVQGTASASPVDPDLTAYENGTTKLAIPLARITLPPSTLNITSGMISQIGNTNNSNVEAIRPIAYLDNSKLQSGRFVEKTGDTLTGKIQFSGTNHAGIDLNNLTTTQRDALTPSLGDLIYNSTNQQAEVYTANGWVGTGITQTQKNALTNQILSNIS